MCFSQYCIIAMTDARGGGISAAVAFVAEAAPTLQNLLYRQIHAAIGSGACVIHSVRARPAKLNIIKVIHYANR
jgi:hypothetical protein